MTWPQAAVDIAQAFAWAIGVAVVCWALVSIAKQL